MVEEEIKGEIISTEEIEVGVGPPLTSKVPPAARPEEGPSELDMEAEMVLERARKFQGYAAGHQKDEYRDPEAAGAGGFQLMDTLLQTRLRSAGKEVLK